MYVAKPSTLNASGSSRFGCTHWCAQIEQPVGPLTHQQAYLQAKQRQLPCACLVHGHRWLAEMHTVTQTGRAPERMAGRPADMALVHTMAMKVSTTQKPPTPASSRLRILQHEPAHCCARRSKHQSVPATSRWRCARSKFHKVSTRKVAPAQAAQRCHDPQRQRQHDDAPV